MQAKPFLIASLILIALGLLGCDADRNGLHELSFDLGAPVEKTLRPHGVSYSGQSVNGLMIYGFAGFKEETTYAIFGRPGYEIRFGPIFGINYYADLKRHPDQLIHLAEISLGRGAVRSHAHGRAALRHLIAQFQHGKWQRYIPDTCPWVTGRSTMLDLTGKVHVGACPLDPALVLTEEDWAQLASQSLRWQWVGDRRVATLGVRYEHNKPDVPTYTINLQFEMLEAMVLSEAKALQEMRAEFGEARVAAGTARGLARIRLLEEAAIKRGDTTIPRP